MSKHLLDNPLGAKGFAGRTIRIGGRDVSQSGREHFATGGERVHLMHFGWRSGKKYALCGAGKGAPESVYKSDAKIVDCYRCLKILRMESSGGLMSNRDLREYGGKREANIMIPGGRQGGFISGKKRSPNFPHGEEKFIGGTRAHPTQPQMLPKSAKVARRAKLGISSLKLIGNPYEVPIDLFDLLAETDSPDLIEAYGSQIMRVIQSSSDPIEALAKRAKSAKTADEQDAFQEAARILSEVLYV